MNINSLVLSACALLVTAGIAVGAVEPAPGSIKTEDGKSIDNASVLIETTDGVEFFLGDWKSPQAAKIQRKRSQYVSVEYVAPEDGNYLKAQIQLDKGDIDKAAASFKQAIASAKWNWEIEDSYLKCGEAFARANKIDDAIATLAEYLQKYPKTAKIAEVVSKRGQWKLKKGDKSGADADFKDMVKNATEWGGSSLREGWLGQAAVMRLDKKFAESATLLSPYFAKLSPDTQADDFALVGLAMADDLHAAGKGGDAQSIYKKLYLSPVSTDAQCKAHLATARMLAEANTTAGNLAAFDHAALAASLGADPETEAGAAKLAKDLAGRLDKDKSVSDADRKEYRTYAASL